MEFFNQAIDILKILVMALGAGLAVWGVINPVSYTHLPSWRYCVPVVFLLPLYHYTAAHHLPHPFSLICADSGYFLPEHHQTEYCGTSTRSRIRKNRG